MGVCEMKEKQLEIQISGDPGTGKAHVMQTIRKALETEYGNTVRFIDRVQRDETRAPLPPPPGEVRIVFTKATKENMDAINNHQAISIHASHQKCLLHWIEFDDHFTLTVGRQYTLKFVPLNLAVQDKVSGLVFNFVRNGKVYSFFTRCIKAPGSGVFSNLKRTFGAFSKKRFNIRWVDYSELDDPAFNHWESQELMRPKEE